MCEPRDLVFCRIAASKKNQQTIKKERKKNLQEAAHMCRTCCSLQTGEACDRIATSSMSCRPSAKHNSLVMITHGLLQITLRNPKNQGLQAGTNRRERESGASEEGSCADESGAEPVRTYLENSHSFNATPPTLLSLIVMSFSARLMTGSLKRHRRRRSRRSAARVMSHLEGVEGAVAAKEQRKDDGDNEGSVWDAP